MTPIEISEERGVRYLHFGSEWVQGAMRIRRPYDLELAYTREMMAGLLMRDTTYWPNTILIIGLGAASLAKFCYWKLPGSQITAVEIEPSVVACAEHYFKLPPQNLRFEIVLDDGFDYIQHTSRQWDMILVDGFDRNARTGKLDSSEFYAACREHLSDQGVMSTNLFGRSRNFLPSFKRIATQFENRALAFPSCDSGNVVAFGATGNEIHLSIVELRERAEQLRERTNLNLLPTIARIQKAKTLRGEILSL